MNSKAPNLIAIKGILKNNTALEPYNNIYYFGVIFFFKHKYFSLKKKVYLENILILYFYWFIINYINYFKWTYIKLIITHNSVLFISLYNIISKTFFLQIRKNLDYFFIGKIFIAILLTTTIKQKLF